MTQTGTCPCGPSTPRRRSGVSPAVAHAQPSPSQHVLRLAQSCPEGLENRLQAPLSLLQGRVANPARTLGQIRQIHVGDAVRLSRGGPKIPAGRTAWFSI